MDTKVSFIEELKRRNVVRVGVVYLIASWLLAQVADLMLENFNAPDWVVQAILVALIIGFPIAVIFAWAFEMTPEGIKKEKDVDRSASITHKTGHLLDRSIIAILVIALSYFVWESRFGSGGMDQNASSSATAEVSSDQAPELETEEIVETSTKSIAVLPFVNMSSDTEQEFFSDGISEEILNALAGIKELKVAGRTSSFAFKGQNQDLRKIGDALGVEHILEGSVRKAGTTVRITAQLIQVKDGFHMWSDTYDRELVDVFAIQDEIANAILKELKAALIDFDSEPVVASATRTDPEVYDLYLLARQRIYERKSLSILSAADLLDKAIAKDPTYAPAYAQRGIAALLLSKRNYGETPRTESGIEGMLYLDKALELDPNLAEAWAGVGLYNANRPGGHVDGIEALNKALEINPNMMDASNWLQVIYSETGDNVKALKLLEDMFERDPLYPPGFGNLVQSYNYFGQQEKAWALLERIRPYLPGDPQLLQSEAVTWMSLGKPSKALPLLQAAAEQQPNDAVVKNQLGSSLMWTGQFEEAIEQGHRWHKAIGMANLGRTEESMIIANELASEGRPGVLIGLLDQADEHEKLLEFFESRWSSLAEYENEYPSGGNGYGSMMRIARAYSKMGNETQFNDAMIRVRIAHDRALEQGIVDPYFWGEEARYYALAGDQERSLALFKQGVDQGMFFSARVTIFWRELEVLTGDPQFESLVVRIRERANEERHELGLEPLST
jgi:TolB-like protein